MTEDSLVPVIIRTSSGTPEADFIAAMMANEVGSQQMVNTFVDKVLLVSACIDLYLDKIFATHAASIQPGQPTSPPTIPTLKWAKVRDSVFSGAQEGMCRGFLRGGEVTHCFLIAQGLREMPKEGVRWPHPTMDRRVMEAFLFLNREFTPCVCDGFVTFL